MQVTRYPLSQTTTPLDLLAAVITDPTGNNGARITNPPTGPDGSPIDMVGLVPIDAAGNFVDLLQAPVSAMTYGVSTANTAALNTTNFNAMVVTLGGGAQTLMVRVPPGTYPMNQISVEKSNLVFDMRGVTFIGPQCEFVTSPAAARVGIIGGTFIRTDAAGLPGSPENDTGPVLHMNGPNNWSDGTWLQKNPEGGGYMVMLEGDPANGFVYLDRLTIRGGNGIFLEGKGHKINVDAVARATGGDDFIAFKARNQETSGCIITGSCSGFGAVCSFGSEIGRLGVTDATRPGRCVNNIVWLVADKCVFGAYFKPGAIDNGAPYDWRSGWVANNVVHLQFRDKDGSALQRCVVWSASRGALVEYNKVFINAMGRVGTNAAVRKNGVDFYIPDYSGAVPAAAAPTIQKNYTEFTWTDPYDGVANGVGGAPGYPLARMVSMEKETAGHGTFNANRVRVTANGSAGSGIYVGTGCDDGLIVERGELFNVNVSGGAVNEAGVFGASRMRIGSDMTVNVITGYPYRETVPGSIRCPEMEEEVFLFQQINLGNADTQYPWTAKRRCQLAELGYTGTVAVAASDIDYTTLGFKNRGGSSVTFISPRTRATGASTTSRNFAIVLGASSVLYKLSDLDPAADAANIAQTLYPEGAVMQMDKTDTGAGRTLQNGRLRIRALPY